MMDSKPSRGTRLPLSQVQQNIQPEKKSSFLKSTQRPLSVPNLKSLFNGSTKPINNENADVEKNTPAEYLPTAYLVPSRKGLSKRNTTIFKDPILETVEEVDHRLAKPITIAEPDRAAPQPESLSSLPASSYQCESIIESTKDITLAQPDAKKDDIITVTGSQRQSKNTQNSSSVYAAPSASSHFSEPEAQETLKAANATEQYLNPPALSVSSEPSVQDAQIITDGHITKVNPPPLSATTEQVLHRISSSLELKDSLIVDNLRGLTKRQSNPALLMKVDTPQVTAVDHAIPQQNGTRNASRAEVSMVVGDHIVTSFLHNASEPSVLPSEAAIRDSNHDTESRDENAQNLLVAAIPMATKDRKVSALYDIVQAPGPYTIEKPDDPLQFRVEEDAQSIEAVMSNATSVYQRSSTLDNGPPPPDPCAPPGLRAAITKSIKTTSVRSNEPCKAPKEEKILSIKKRRDTTIRTVDYPQPLPLAPVLQPPGTHQYVENCAAIGILGLQAVPSRYVTPHFTLKSEHHGVDPSKDEEAYDSYEEEDDYVTARSCHSYGETTNDGATTDLFPRWNSKARREIAEATVLVESTRTQEDLDDEAMDPTMVAEYADEIFEHLRQLEVKMLPNPFYMEEQTELQWSMRSVLMDWLVQVHSRCNLLPETLFITANFVDRFLSGKIVSLGKLQLVGATALFLAAKKEEINCPTLSEIVYMVDNTYSADELIKAERYMLNILKWELEFPGPMSFLRRISKADDYDLETRTLAKYFLEVILMEERFIGTPCSFAAAASHCMARMMLQKSLWTPYHVFYSNYTYSQLYPLLRMLLFCVENPMRHHAAVYEKYADKRFKRASTYVEVQVQRGFVLPNPTPASSNKVVVDLAATYTMTTYSNPFNHHVAASTPSGRVFST